MPKSIKATWFCQSIYSFAFVGWAAMWIGILRNRFTLKKNWKSRLPNALSICAGRPTSIEDGRAERSRQVEFPEDCFGEPKLLAKKYLAVYFEGVFARNRILQFFGKIEYVSRTLVSAKKVGRLFPPWPHQAKRCAFPLTETTTAFLAAST